MTTALQAPADNSEFTNVLDELRSLTRDHLLVYRVEVGRVLLERFFGGNSAAYLDMDSTKEQRFSRFVGACAAELTAFSLGERTLRNCIRTSIVFHTLPPAAREQLAYSQIVELTRIGDPTLRSRLAVASLAGEWTVLELKEAIGEAKAGIWYDNDDATPGTQPPPLPPPAAKAAQQPGRLVTRAEKWLDEIDTWSGLWASVDPAKLSRSQHMRVQATVLALRRRLDELERSLTK